MFPRLTTAFVTIAFAAALYGVSPPPDTGPPGGPRPHPSRHPAPTPTPCNTAPNTPPINTPPINGPTPYPGLESDFTPPPAGDPNSAPQADFNDPAVQQLYNQGMQMMPPSPNPSSTPCLPDVNNPLLPRILAAAESFANHSTAVPGTQCNDGKPGDGPGNCACGYAMEQVIKIATGVDLGTAYWDVDTWRSAATSGRFGGSFVTDDTAHPGAIIMWGAPGAEAQHIGVCMTAGCTQTLSNSSSYREFSPQPPQPDSISLNGTYSQWVIWEPEHIP